ncbi:Crp/Fnr family transcriptional regulator [Aurantibacter crassamenti]|uniref:Crp/Fnr family transcriptional regulator n=1 Tax=Aurantibacter crassamenti TaxID=1837375 RepID=UPI0019397F10|nr:Crp/Fnr family transcriptional regulator [Aurantibacter crassamenti]MBM1106241.1 Crp/Fnr family transcriptional regulator [Aurantibacter crassamenti]
MTNILVAQMNQLTKLSEEEALAIEESFPIRSFDKGHFLLQQGQVAKDSYFVIKGCVRKYSTNSDGEDRTTDFFTEGHSVANFNSLSNQKPSNHSFVCSEKTTVAVLNTEKEKALYKRFPRFEAICRVEFEKMMGEKVDDFEKFVGKTPEEKYLYVLKERPDLINRVPQYQLASYLGVKPETLSRIRKRIIQQ